MRILFLALDVNLNGRTGDSIHTRELVVSLSGAGQEVALVGSAPEGLDEDVSNIFEEAGVSVHIPKSTGNLATLRFCSRITREFRPEVIYERRFSPKLGAGLSMLHKLPLVVEVNGLLEEELEIQGRGEEARKVSGKARKSLRKRFFDRAGKIVAVTDGIKTGLEGLYNIPSGKITVVHNGANTNLFRPMDKSSCREKLGLDADKHYLCFVGILLWWQGVDDIIRAVPKVEENIPGVDLMIVGDGAQRKELEDLVQDLGLSESVHFTGRVPYEKVPIYMNASDVCLAPKRVLSSGYSPLKLYEYMACGKPVIASRVAGFEILEKGAGLLFEPENVDDLSSNIVKVLSDRELMDSMGVEGRRIVEKEYSWRAVGERISSLLREVAS
ncbi:MAG: glycosyltransferase family 4 protein [Methanobacteriota archaeon]|nr:MAG: glycosyltransferase family 4 protein [Euryarchaeota archaeon]